MTLTELSQQLNDSLWNASQGDVCDRETLEAYQAEWLLMGWQYPHMQQYIQDRLDGLADYIYLAEV